MKKITFDIRYANEFLKEEVEQFKTILESTNQVEMQFFDSLVRRNPRLLFAYNDENLLGIGAIKIPNSVHKDTVFKRVEASDQSNQFEFEIGWIVSKIENEGIGTQIVNLLVEESKSNVYSTVRSNNFSMISILNKSGFKKIGIENSNNEIEVFVNKM